jgi:hypothetical protein
MRDAVLEPVRPAFRAIAATVVPEAAALAEAEWAVLEAIVEDALRQRPARVRRQLGLLIRVIDGLARVTTGRRLHTLDLPRRLRLLERLQHAPLLLLRRGIWGLRTLIFMGFYARPAAAAAIGYRADPRGWDARR